MKKRFTSLAISCTTLLALLLIWTVCASLTVSAEDGEPSPAYNPPTTFELGASQYHQVYTGNLQLWYTLSEPAGTTYTWTTSKSSVATVSSGGLLTFHNIGAVDVTVTASTGATSTKTFYGVYPDGIYEIQNTGSYMFATLENDRIVQAVNVSQYRDQNEALKQLWRIKYLGEGKYSISAMLNPSLRLAVAESGTDTRNVMAYPIAESDPRAIWEVTGTTYSNVIRCYVDDTNYRLAITAGDASDYSNIFAYSPTGSGSGGWRFNLVDTDAEGVLIYNHILNKSNKTIYLSINNALQLTAIYYTSQADAAQTFTWATNNESIASVDSNGLVTAINEGRATITATSTVDSRYSAYCYIQVSSDSDFDGVADANDPNGSSNTYTGQLIAHNEEDDIDEYFDVEYAIDYSAFLLPPSNFQSSIAEISSVASALAYKDRQWYDTTISSDKCGIIQWLGYHGMSSVKRISIEASDDHLSEIIIGFRPVVDGTDKTLIIAVIIRGTNGTIEEWSSNVDIGNTAAFSSYPEWINSSHHMGFDITSERILDAVNNYITTRIGSKFPGFTHTYWVTGHSRGGALANLVAAKLTNQGKRVFAYTFAAPGTVVCSRCLGYGYSQCEESTGCTPHASTYNNIFNIINTDDFIPYFPLPQWCFTLYGRTARTSVGNYYASTWQNSWEDEDGNAISKTYMRMANIATVLSKFYAVAPTRNSCYDHGTDVVPEIAPIYPDNTIGYYTLIPQVTATGLITSFHVKHSPMFLMKYFVAVAADEVSGANFKFNNIADYLEDAKETLINEITGYATLSDDKTRLEYPHLPQSYCLLALRVTASMFN